jgi:predicted glycosyltransferase involved in capsule biosynthesis
MASNNNNTSIARDILSSLVEELESLGISINHIHHLNDNRELYHLADNLKQEFMNEIREMEEQGLFVNPGGG